MKGVNAAVVRNLPAVGQPGNGTRGDGIGSQQALEERADEAQILDARGQGGVESFRVHAIDDDEIGLAFGTAAASHQDKRREDGAKTPPPGGFFQGARDDVHATTGSSRRRAAGPSGWEPPELCLSTVKIRKPGRYRERWREGRWAQPASRSFSSTRRSGKSPRAWFGGRPGKPGQWRGQKRCRPRIW